VKKPDIAQTPIVKWFGIRGAKLYVKILFSILYLMLIALTAGLWIVGPVFPNGWCRIVLACFIGGLIVFAVSLLTRMRMKFLAEIEQLESQPKTV
jgi:prepilin signal peptidase PulO-like enzyme (type II secretory pathway)